MFEKRRLDKMRIEILQRIANPVAADLDPDHYPMLLGTDAERACASIATCGTFLLDWLIAEPPVKSGQSEERKRLINALTVETGERASIYLAHAIVRGALTRDEFLSRFEAEVAAPTTGERDDLSMFAAHYPLLSAEEEALRDAESCYRLFDAEPGDIEPPIDPSIGSGYTMYLTGAESFQPENDEDLQRLVNSHFMVSGDRFRDIASRHAFGIVLGPGLADSKLDQLTVDDVGFERLNVGLTLGHGWKLGEEKYYELLGRISHQREGSRYGVDRPDGLDRRRPRAVMDRELGESIASQGAEAGVDEGSVLYQLVLEALARMAESWWEWNPGPGKAIVQAANKLSTSREDFNLVVDAAEFGYWIRELERDVTEDVNVFDPEYTAQLRQHFERDQAEAITVAMTQVATGLPAPFGPGPEAWSYLLELAIPVLEDRGRTMLAQDDELDEDVEISREHREFALGLGYGYGYAVGALGIDGMRGRS